MKRNDNIIVLKGVWKTYSMGEVEVHALRGLSLEVKRGEFIAIQGPSGSGKSTAMNMIGCLDVPTKGSIRLEGHDISHMSESDLAQIRGKKIGFIFQQFNLINTLTATENVTLPMIFQGIGEEERQKHARELLYKVGLSERLGHLPTQLSGGQQQRVAISRALIHEPKFIVCDEPTAALDAETGYGVMKILRDIADSPDCAVLVVTHDNRIYDFADRILEMADGRIIGDHLPQNFSHKE